MTSGFQEEFRQAMDLGASDASKESSSSPDDAVHRTSGGPRLLAAPEIPTALTEPPAAADTDGDRSPATKPQADMVADGGTLPADVPPASGGGPELITPRRPVAPPEDDAGTSSAA